MSANSSNNHKEHNVESDEPQQSRQQVSWKMMFIFPAWVFVSYMVANVLIVTILWILGYTGSKLPMNTAVFQTVVSCAMYLLTFAITAGVPYLVRRRTVTIEKLGLQRLPTWSDIGLAPLAFIGYLLVSAFVLYIIMQLIPSFPHNDVQDVGFKALSHQYEYTLAFFTLVVIAPFAEETLFRGYLFGRLKKYVPLIPAVLVTSLLFAAAHLPGGDHVQWNVAIDVFVLSIVLCFLRVLTGSIWAGILLHMLKNAVAFYLTFVGPMLMLGS